MNHFKQCLQKFKSRHEPQTIDELLYKYGIGSCFRLLPPSFYRKHSPEKAKRLHDEEIAELKQMLEDYKKKHNLGDE